MAKSVNETPKPIVLKTEAEPLRKEITPSPKKQLQKSGPNIANGGPTKLMLETDVTETVKADSKPFIPKNLFKSAPEKPQELAKIASGAGEQNTKTEISQPKKIEVATNKKIETKQVQTKNEAQSSDIKPVPQPPSDFPVPVESKKPERSVPVENKPEQIKVEQKPEAPLKSLTKIQIWEGKEGAGLKGLLNEWAEQSDIKIDWKTKKKYELKMDLFISGTYENALKTLFSMGVENPPSYMFDKDKRTLTISE